MDKHSRHIFPRLLSKITMPFRFMWTPGRATKSLSDPLKSHPIPVFFAYVIPTTFGLVSMSIAGIVDMYFLGNSLGPDGLAGVNIALSPITFLFGLSTMISIGGPAVCGKSIGENNILLSRQFFSMSLFLNLLIQVCAVVILMPLLPYIIGLIGASENVVQYALEYLYHLLPFYPFLASIFIIAAFIRLDNRPTLAGMMIILAAVWNIVLDYYLIGVLNLGAKGAALATGSSIVPGILLSISYFLSKSAKLKITRSFWNLKMAYNIMKHGASEITVYLSYSVLFFFIYRLVALRMGDLGLSALAFVESAILIITIFTTAVAESNVSLLSINFGSGNFKRIRSFFFLGILSVVTVSSVLIISLWYFSDAFVHFFVSNPTAELIDYFNRILTLLWPMLFFGGLNELFATVLTSLNQPIRSLIITLQGSLILPIIFILILPSFLGDNGIFIAMSLAEVLTFFTALAIIMYTVKNIKYSHQNSNRWR